MESELWTSLCFPSPVLPILCLLFVYAALDHKQYATKEIKKHPYVSLLIPCPKLQKNNNNIRFVILKAVKKAYKIANKDS